MENSPPPIDLQAGWEAGLFPRGVKPQIRTWPTPPRVAAILERLSNGYDHAAPRRRKARGFANIRIEETKALLEGRLGIAGVLELPDSVQSRKFVSFMLEHIANTKGNVRRAMGQCCELYASSWLDDDAIEAMIEAALDEASYRPEKWTARASGDWLGVTDDERCRYGLTTFRAIDVDDAEYERRHKEANAERQQRYRDREKAITTTAVPKRKPPPWVSAGKSRATYFRHKAADEKRRKARPYRRRLVSMR